MKDAGKTLAIPERFLCATGSDAESMAAGVVDALLLYYATVALVVLVHLVGLWFNPAALKTYDWVGKRLSDKWPSWRH